MKNFCPGPLRPQSPPMSTSSTNLGQKKERRKFTTRQLQIIYCCKTSIWECGMKRKIRVGVVFGGKSAEHEISLLSAKNIFEALDRKKYEPLLIGIDKNGEWHVRDNRTYLSNANHAKKVA